MSARADRLEKWLAEQGFDALVVTNLVNVRYLTGYTGSNGICVVGPDLRVFFTDFRYVTQAAEQVQDFDRFQGQRDLFGEVAERLIGRVGFEDATMTVRQHERLSGLVGDRAELVAAGNPVEELRAVKDIGEIAAIRAAAQLADEALENVLANGLAGRTEKDVAVALEFEMRRLGAEEPAFPSIVAADKHGALPHAVPRDVEIPSGVLCTIDWGARLDGYCSDCTRTYATGELDAEAAAVYELVREAQEKSEASVRSGESGRDVDSIARTLIDDAGHADHFGHGLGHGVGLEVHEGPRLAPTSDDTLATGMVVTVEPGVYVPGRLGVRIEDLVVVEDGEPEVLSSLTKALVTVG